MFIYSEISFHDAEITSKIIFIKWSLHVPFKLITHGMHAEMENKIIFIKPSLHVPFKLITYGEHAHAQRMLFI